MKIKAQVKRWGNSLGLVIPGSIADSLDLKVNHNILFSTEKGRLIIELEESIPTLNEILDSIPTGYRHPEDLQDFLESEPEGRELI